MRTSFYASQSLYSEPGPYRDTLMRGGVEPGHVARWISSFMQHPRGAEAAERGFTPEQAADLELRSVAELLSVAVARGLLDGEAAQPEIGARPKVGGVCRDFAILAVSLFRARGTPARLRAGFADYIVPGHWEDHWLCEWHDGGRWRRFDVEFAAIGDLAFDTLDVPRDRFITAGEAWFRIRREPDVAARFGVSSLDLHGAWFVAGSLMRDIAALRKLELKPWDYWGLSQDLSRDSAAWPRHAGTTLDQLASRLGNADMAGEGEPQSIREWPLPREVVGFPHGAPMAVVLRHA